MTRDYAKSVDDDQAWDDVEHPNPNGKSPELSKEYYKRLRGRPRGQGGLPSGHRQAKKELPSGALIEDDDDEPSSWEPVDLGPVLRGEVTEPAPSMLQRADGKALIYPGKLHGLHADSESGKTWLALVLAAERMQAGETVMYLDFEDTASGIIERLRALDVEDDVIREHFIYLGPDDPPSDSRIAHLTSTARGQGVTVAILDSVTQAMNLLGLSLYNNDDYAKFVQRLVRPLARTGAAVLLLDHVTKDPQDRPRGPIGGVHKLNCIDGAVYSLTNSRPFGRNRTGMSVVKVEKDRPGHVRAFAGEGRKASVALFEAQGLIKADGDHMQARLKLPGSVPSDSPHAFDGQVAENVSDVLSRAGKPLSGNKVYEQLKEDSKGARKATVNAVLGYLVDAGYADKTEDGYVFVAHYTAKEDESG